MRIPRIALGLLIAAMLLSLGCSVFSGDADSLHPTVPPPEQVVFNGIGEFRDFAVLTEKGGVEFSDLLRNKSYDMNGVSGRKDAERVLAAIDALPFPNIDGFVFDSSNLRFDDGSFHVHFKSGADDGRYIAFNIALESSDAEADKRTELRNGGKLADIPSLIGSELNYLIRSSRKDERGINDYCITNIRSHRIDITTNLSEDELLNILENCSFTTMREYAENAAPQA